MYDDTAWLRAHLLEAALRQSSVALYRPLASSKLFPKRDGRREVPRQASTFRLDGLFKVQKSQESSQRLNFFALFACKPL
jgi:hypothetical protein